MNRCVDLLIITDRQTGGVPVTTIDLARGLAELGCNVTLLADPEDGRGLLPDAIAAGVRHVAWPGQTSIAGLRMLWREVMAKPWTVVLSSHRGCDIAVHAACALSGRRHALVIHGDPAYEAAGTRFAALRTRLWRNAVGRSCVVVAISAFIAERTRRFFPRLPPIAVVPNANARHPPAESPVSLPLGVRPRLVACGRIYDAKRPELLRPLVQALEQMGVVCEAVWVGGGERQAELQADAATHGLADRVRFIGHHEDPWEELRAGHLFVHFCTIEGFGLAIIEALAAGLPVAAFAAGALPELIADGREGVLAPAVDLAELARRIAPLLSDPQRHHAAASAALARAHDFTRAAMAEGYRRALLESA